MAEPLNPDAFLGALHQQTERLAGHPFLGRADGSGLARRFDPQRHTTVEALFGDEPLFDADPECIPGYLLAVLVARDLVAADRRGPTTHPGDLDLRKGLPFRERTVLYGDVRVKGDLWFDNWLVVLGDLDVAGVVEATEEFSPLFVAGELTARGLNAYRWCCSVVVGGALQVEEVVAISQNLAVGGRPSLRVLLEGDGVWRVTDNVTPKHHFTHEVLEASLERPDSELTALFRRELFGRSEVLADDHAFIANLFGRLRKGESIWR